MCTQNYAENTTQACQCQSCTSNYTMINASTQNYIQNCANSSCVDGCDCCSISPHCEYCTCSQDGENNAYVDIEINQDPNHRSLPLTSLLQSGVDHQNNASVLSYPIIIKNGDRTINVNSNRSSLISGNISSGQSNTDPCSSSLTRLSRSGRNNCYEVTVNLEWI
jgi:hypothetical protein